ncbi:DUF1878 domain-containing protein [Terribacillus saccharophilus]|uniref:DUF1878 domain-containing protein n=2 Tax=Terribacillus saccharophilus TaxID=361277 RepID=A0ABX4GWS4_9BACI|nr:DUF1878 domain-containing protein [Terribacillus saccharophilus]PAD95754.1 DUF1878 domain-containing protein [Terribacillus saccharophilus]PAD99324.1 DUF1878 domain-containing protein [Terribacillus saccharophilus]PAF17645.1 DUF1878 domain-containing protein [Terribacillus saccharophilus]PAF21507.1 DUF1878 domain-containing protein [Terribacillus saccharophilus]
MNGKINSFPGNFTLKYKNKIRLYETVSLKGKGSVFMEEEKKSTLSFHLHLIAETGVLDKYPFRKLLIERNINEEEYAAVLKMLQRLNRLYKEQKEEGLLDYTSLLLEFVGMMPEKLYYWDVLLALREEKQDDTYKGLVDELILLDMKNRY